MDFRASILWVYKAAPSELPKLLWRYSYEDLKVVCRRAMEEEIIKAQQERLTLRSALIEVVGAALGWETQTAAKPVQSASELRIAMAAMGVTEG